MTSITHKILKKNYIKILQDSNIWRYGQKKGAPFVCIEPWQNTADRIDSIQIYKDKKKILLNYQKIKNLNVNIQLNFKNMAQDLIITISKEKEKTRFEKMLKI